MLKTCVYKYESDFRRRIIICEIEDVIQCDVYFNYLIILYYIIFGSNSENYIVVNTLQTVLYVYGNKIGLFGEMIS